MKTMRAAGFAGFLRRFRADRSGATSIEYAIIAFGISVAIAATIFAVRDTLLENYFDRIAPAFETPSQS